jgi:hypothetical protein
MQIRLDIVASVSDPHIWMQMRTSIFPMNIGFFLKTKEQTSPEVF